METINLLNGYKPQLQIGYKLGDWFRVNKRYKSDYETLWIRWEYDTTTELIKLELLKYNKVVKTETHLVPFMSIRYQCNNLERRVKELMNSYYSGSKIGGHVKDYVKARAQYCFKQIAAFLDYYYWEELEKDIRLSTMSRFLKLKTILLNDHTSRSVAKGEKKPTGCMSKTTALTLHRYMLDLYPYIDTDIVNLRGAARSVLIDVMYMIEYQYHYLGRDSLFAPEPECINKDAVREVLRAKLESVKPMLKTQITMKLDTFVHLADGVRNAKLNPPKTAVETHFIYGIYKHFNSVHNNHMYDTTHRAAIKTYNQGKEEILRVWQTFKATLQLTGVRYSSCMVRSMLNYVSDGQRLGAELARDGWEEYKLMTSGSLARMIDDARFNHMEEQKYRLKIEKKLVDSVDGMPLVEEERIPETLKPYLLRTVGELVRGGIECDHCLGTYGRNRMSNDHGKDVSIFFRKEMTCAEVHVSKIGKIKHNIIQCFSPHDTITPISKAFEKEINGAFSKLSESYKPEKVATPKVETPKAPPLPDGWTDWSDVINPDNSDELPF